MKSLYLAISIVLLTVSSHAQSFEFSNSHTALHVKDVNESAVFYADVLRLEEMTTPEGFPETIRWFHLADNTEIHLIQSDELVKIPKGIHLSFATKNLEKFIALLETKKIHYENWFGDKNSTNTRGDGIKQIYIQDKDGYWIEINDGVK